MILRFLPENNMSKDNIYLGDGVYLARSNYAEDFVLLYTSNGVEFKNIIYLNREVAQSLVDVITKLLEE